MDISKLSVPLSIDQVEFRVQSINKGGYATLLVYKDARADQQRLDDAVGPLNWQRRHTGGNHNCIVSIWCDEKKEWVAKEDTGTESNAEAAKGLASDSFKRACFNWGIGRELYNYPDLSVKLQPKEWKLDEKKKDKWGNAKPTATWDLKIKEWSWYSEFNGNQITFLSATDNNGNMRYSWGNKRPEPAPKPSFTEELFKAQLEDITAEIATNGKTAEQIIVYLEKSYTVGDGAKAAIRGIK